MKKIACFMCSLFVLSGCMTDANSQPKEQIADVSKYESIEESKHQYIKSSFDKFFKTVEEKKDGLFYIGYPACPWCVEILPILNDVAKEKNTYINYIELYDDENKQTFKDEDRIKFVKEMEAYLDSSDDGAKTLYVPFVFYIKDGKVSANHIATFDGHNAYERKMNEDEVNKLRDVYRKMW